ncbi:MAG: methyltransferase [Synergistaceae bacterium]|jgi:tRNA1(Val) A37 N6-methylase TrmN6|nr:methyltransferase [Synergistaceae bacterium]
MAETEGFSREEGWALVSALTEEGRDVSPSDILYGRVRMYQPTAKRGPRVSVDTVLLAHFARVRRGDRVIEMGCAHGAITLIMAKRNDRARFEGFDINPELIDMARENALLNGLGGRVSFFASDLREHKKNFAPESYDAVVMNPPYDDPGTSRPSPDEAMASARHGRTCALSDVVACAKYLLRNGGRFASMMRANRMGDLFRLLYEHNVRPKKIRAVHPKPDRPASIVLVEAVRASGDGVTVEPPLFICGSDGGYTKELLEAYSMPEGEG